MDIEDKAVVRARESAEVVEISLAWGDRVLGLVPLAKRKEFFLGEEIEKGKACEIFLPEEVLGTRRHRLLTVDAIGTVRLCPPSQARGWIRLADGLQMDLLEMTPAGVDADFVLPSSARVHLELGEFVLTVRAVGRAPRVPRGLSALDARIPFAYFASSLAVFGSLFAVLAYVTPPLGLEADADIDKERLLMLQQYMSASALREREEPKPDPAQQSGAESGGPSGAAAAGAAGTVGTTKPTDSRGRFAVKKTNDQEELALSRTAAREDAKTFGMIGLLASSLATDPAPTSPWGPEMASGHDALNANGAMWAAAIGEGPGSGGLGLSGIGEGGGMNGRWVGMGDIGVGNGLGGPGPGGFGISAGHPSGTHKTKVPKMAVIGEVTTSGRLPAEVIQRTVRQNFGRFRMCYQQGLSKNPSLEGRVSMRFVIGRDGAVSNVGMVGSGLPDAAVNDCLRGAFYGISFTQPENGIVQVTYPLLFSPE